MMKKKINPRPVVVAAMILAAGMYRLFMASGPHELIASLTPLGAMALFSGCYFRDKWKAFLFPLLTLWLTDILLNRFVYFHEWTFFYDGFIWVYASFVIMVLIGNCIRQVSIAKIVIAAIAAALSHWVVADIGVWLSGGCVPSEGPYSPTFNTFILTLEFALPSMYKMLIGNLLFCSILFGAFEIMQCKFTLLQAQTSHP